MAVVPTGTLTAASLTPVSPIAGSTVTLTYGYAQAAYVEVSGSYTGAALTFECSSDGTNWQSMFAATVEQGNVTNAYTLTDNQDRVFFINGLVVGTQLRVRCTAIATGTINVVISVDADASGGTQPFLSLSGISVATIGQSFNLGTGHYNFSVQTNIRGTGSFGSVSLVLQGSLDNSTFYTMGAAVTSTSGALTFYTGSPVTAFRLSCGTLSIGASAPLLDGFICGV